MVYHHKLGSQKVDIVQTHKLEVNMTWLHSWYFAASILSQEKAQKNNNIPLSFYEAWSNCGKSIEKGFAHLAHL